MSVSARFGLIDRYAGRAGVLRFACNDPACGIASFLLAAALATSPALADSLTPKQAIQVMVKAGYAGIAGVTHDKNFYYAAAISPDRKRVRVTVDEDSGKIVAVMPLVLGGSAPPAPVLKSDAPLPTIHYTMPPPMFAPYQPIAPPHPVGVIQYPFNSAGKLQPAWCRFHANAPGC